MTTYKRIGAEIVRLLAYRPRSTPQEIQAAIGSGMSSVNNALYALKRNGLIRQEHVSRRTAGTDEKFLRVALWSLVPIRPAPRGDYEEREGTLGHQIVRFLRENSGWWTRNEIAQALGLAQASSLWVYMKPLLDAGIAERAADKMSHRDKNGRYVDRVVYVYRLVPDQSSRSAIASADAR
jgi:predicted transcriptional regulator